MSFDLRLERTYDAAPEVVFDAFTDPEAQQELYADAPDWIVEATCDLRVVGHDRVIGHMGTIATLPRPCEAPSRCDITSPGHLPADQDKAGRPRRPAIAAPSAGSGVVVTMR